MEVQEALKDYLLTLNAKPAHRLILSFNKLREYNKNVCQELINNPITHLPVLIEEVKKIGFENVGFTGALDLYSPRSLDASCISKIICMEGIVVSCSLFKPKLVKSVHYSNAKNIFYEKEYTDAYSMSKYIRSNSIPSKDSNGPLQTEFGLSEFIDYQSVMLQELIEESPVGQLPRSVEVVMFDDLVDMVKPGDRAKFYGVYKSIANINQGCPTSFRTVLIVNNAEKINDSEVKNEVMNQEDKIKAIVKYISQNQNPLELISKSIAPAIFGHEALKKAVALLIVGGNEIIRKNQSKIRGDINILMVGDPGTAKSQLLRYVNSIAFSILTSGKGSTGVGLTAAVTLDKESMEKRLEAGAMVLADRGICLIDEFDKMDEDDRTNIHEVMEQQTVTISKAGIHTTLNARCAVLAAANPILSFYKRSLTPSKNIGMAESLLTRFDLIFVILDNKDYDEDVMISRHVVQNHQGIRESYESGFKDWFESTEEVFNERIINPDSIFTIRDNGTTILDQKALMIYLQEVKKLRPSLSSEASELISKSFVDLRQEKGGINLVTCRVLETMIRLATAIAKLRYKTTVSSSDAYDAVSLVRKSLFFEVHSEQTVAKKQRMDGSNLNKLVLDQLMKYQNNNPALNSMKFDVLLEILRCDRNELLSVVEELNESDLILFYDGTIFFLN